MNDPNEKSKKGDLPKKRGKKKFNITYEILQPGTLKRNPTPCPQDPVERWEEIIDICAEVIREDSKIKKMTKNHID